ncbi:anti-phage defense-associated sirtuin Dsr2 [Photobacterium leiognathi]|uniref:anti-phage defense-associated sirtuin Dsr2 n=1 Tax=Photobacterium leiognathi TaxID=553611 RepID=UPI002982567E|nr:anti-phage defense-associated sirtuin Dsr2 [Photobacterium leiognathi]
MKLVRNIPKSIQPYLDEIAQCLWSKNASIMIGAGFSMNAKAMFDNAKRFPSWQDLGNVFYEKVRGEKIADAKYNFFDPLKLAYEVESNFGRPVLDNILRTSIPDGDYKPSELHHSLLSLPWTDVFTTNYDTLLERAAESVNDRNYKVVVHKDNLVHSTPPRIVKLHGCFSASTPLIISEEDYRTYPQKFAPFVNTVQQTLLENTLCLIGFSGDDPNFLKWIGWIRDNLGSQNSPKIYLIGVLNLSTSQEKALSQYNITCVDMSVCKSVGEKDHQAGIDAFIRYCEQRKESETQRGWKLSSELSCSRFNSTKPPKDNEVEEEITQLISLWKNERLSYPNWLVVPSNLRHKLWNYTSNWSSILDKKTRISTPLLKEFVYEFLWRKEKSLLPIFDNEVESIKLAISSLFSTDSTSNGDTIYIALALLRYYREEGKSDEWYSLFNKLEAQYSGQHYQDYLIYERALFLLIDNKNVALMDLLSTWVSGNSSAIWMYRKASILAEINKLTDSQDILEQALIKTRRKINAGTVIIDYANVSLESYILVLLNNVNYALSIKTRDWNRGLKPEYLERLEELRQFQCSPLEEKQYLELEIKHNPTPFKQVTVTNGFDLGTQQTTQYYFHGNEEVLNAFRLLRFFEDASLPFSLPHLNIGVNGANSAIERVSSIAPYWSMTTMLRTRNKKSSELIFTRESLSQFESSFIDNLAKRYIKLLSSYLNQENSMYEYGLVLPEVLSRLCCRATLPVKDEIAGLLLQIYSNKNPHNSLESLDKLVKRLMDSFSNNEVFNRIGIITEISVYTISNDVNKMQNFNYPNPFDFILGLSCSNITSRNNDVSVSNDIIKAFLLALESENKEARRNAISTLVTLNDLGLLNKNQVKSFLAKLLSDKDIFGLPQHTNYYKSAFLEIYSGNTKFENNFREYLSALSPLVQANTDDPSSFTLSGRADQFTKELTISSKKIKFTNDELHQYALKLIGWWQADKVIFEEYASDSKIRREMVDRFSLFVESLNVVIIKNKLAGYETVIKDIIFELKSLGLNYLSLKAVSAQYLSIDVEEFINELDESLSSFKKELVIDALYAINHVLSKDDNLDFRFIDAFSTFIKYSRGLYLSYAFEVVINILNEKGMFFNSQFENSVLKSLDRTLTGFDLLDFEENLSLQTKAAKLASVLSLYYIASSKDLPAVIRLWAEHCNSQEEFAEIRNQWKAC